MRLPTRDVLTATLASLAIISAIRKEIVVAMLARRFIAIDPLPGVKEHVLAFNIGPVPAGQLGGPRHKHLKPLLLGRVATDIQFKKVERSAKAFDLGARGVLLGPIQ